MTYFDYGNDVSIEGESAIGDLGELVISLLDRLGSSSVQSREVVKHVEASIVPRSFNRVKEGIDEKEEWNRFIVMVPKHVS